MPGDPADDSHSLSGTDGSRGVFSQGGNSLRWTIPLLAGLACVIAWRGPGVFAPGGQDSPAIGRPAPRIDLVVLNTEPRLERIQAIPDDTVTVLHFWGTWCGPCRREFPELARMVERHQSSTNFQFLPVSCEGHSNETLQGLLEKTTRYYRSEGIVGTSFVDPQGITRRSVVERMQGTMAYPTTVVIDGGGKIAGVWVGYTARSVDQIDSLVTRLLQQMPNQQASL